MANPISSVWVGLPELEEKLEALTNDLKFKGGRFALRKAANVIRQQAVVNALAFNDPQTPTEIYKNVTVRWASKTFKRTGDLAFRVGVLGGARKYGDTKQNRRAGIVGKTYKTAGDKTNPGGDTWYWRFKEFGVPSRGIPASPFLRSAGESSALQAINVFMVNYQKALERALAAQKKKAK